MEIITGYTGENHVTSADDASLYRGIFGQGDYVLDVGNKFAATIIDNNTVRIMDGDLVIQGHQARIRANDYEEVTIDNGTPGEKRNDLIVARYQKNTTTGIESITLEVVKGTPGATAVDPDVVQEDLSTGGTQRDFPLYRVSLNGLVLESVTSLFTVLPNFEDFMTHLADYEKEATVFYIEDTDIYNFRAADNYLSRYYKKNGWVHLQVQCTRKDENAFSLDEDIFIMPVGVRPKRTFEAAGLVFDSSAQIEIMRLIFQGTGEIRIGSQSAYKILRFQVSYYAGGGTL